LHRTPVRRLPLAATVLVLAAILVSACTQAPSTAATAKVTAAPQAVQVAKVGRSNLASVVNYSGDIRATSSVILFPKVSGRIEKMYVDVGSAIKTGDKIAEIEHSMLDVQLAQAEAGVAVVEARLTTLRKGPRQEAVGAAEANLKAAQERLANLQAGARSENVGAAQANLDAAKARLAQAKAGPTQEQIKAAQLGAIQARNALFAAQVNRDGVCGNGRAPQYLCDAAQASVNTAQTAWDQAEQQVKVLTQPPTKETTDQLEAAVAAAQQQLALASSPYTSHDVGQAAAAVDAAQQQLDLAKKPFTDEDVKTAEANLAQARAAVDLVKLQQKEAVIISPIDGVIADRPVNVGSMAAPTAPLVTINAQTVKAVVPIEETRLGELKVGQQVKLNLAAFPGQPFTAKIATISPTVDSKTRTATVDLTPDDPKQQLKPGMFAQAEVALAQRSNVLVVPRNAVVDQAGRSAVFVVVDGLLRRVDIRTGVVDGDRVEVLEGLDDGQDVVLSPRPELRDGVAVTVQR
jgi:HlyD family secretion protein